MALITACVALVLSSCTSRVVVPLDCTPSWIMARSGATLITAVPLTCTLRFESHTGWAAVAVIPAAPSVAVEAAAAVAVVGGAAVGPAVGVAACAAVVLGKTKLSRTKTSRLVKRVVKIEESCFIGCSFAGVFYIIATHPLRHVSVFSQLCGSRC